LEELALGSFMARWKTYSIVLIHMCRVVSATEVDHLGDLDGPFPHF
jgi:hypothetical protein